MAISYEQTLAFLTQSQPELTPQQAERLRAAAQDLCDRVAEAATQLKEARVKAEALAKAAGFGDLDEMIQRLGLATIREQAAQLRDVANRSIVVRKPFMSPQHPDRIFSCAAHHATPPELRILLDAGWSKTELHYKNLAAACKARGVALNFDPVKRHAELAALERQ